ncbi:MAG: AfsR/SARP family transcriptional regulator, partial [Thermoleophilia bacterium]|nr:AfsR/SARP family transcriptional regulator [Thermoleophilia bacterium]
MAAVEILILGDLEVAVADAVVPINSAKQRALLMLLVLADGRTVSRERIIDALWGERPPATAAKNVQVLVGRLRDLLEPGRTGAQGALIATEPSGYRLDRGRVQVDVDRMRGHMAEGRAAFGANRVAAADAAFTAARAAWRGPSLGSLATEAWAVADAAALDEELLLATEGWIDARLAMGDHDAALLELGQLTPSHPLRERCAELRMIALYRAGRQSEALEVYQRTRRRLDETLGLEPGPALRQLQRRILEQDPSLDFVAASTRTRLPPPPRPATQTLGRELELEELSTRLDDPHVRLVSITGFGGMGKTRLATELATHVADRFEDVGFIELASIANASLVPAALETALGIAQGEGDAVEAIATFLGDRTLLLVLDNFEHVLDAAPVVTRLLESCPRLTIVATTRERLGLAGEHEFQLGP